MSGLPSVQIGFECPLCVKVLGSAGEAFAHFLSTHQSTPPDVRGDPKPEDGMKYDKDKARWDLLPFKAASQVVDVLTYGAKKYAPEDWRKVDGWRWRYFGAAMRHMVAWIGGERIDPESKLPHLAHAACCVLFMLELDRPSDQD